MTGIPEADHVTLTCPECGEEISGPERGRMNATMKLGTHMWVKHQVRGSGRARAGDVDADSLTGQPPAISVVRSISDGVRRGGKGAPSADDLANGLGRGVSLTTVFVSSLILDADDTLGDDEREEWISALSVQPGPARDLMRPIGRAAAGTRLNARIGRQVVDNVDVLSSVFELGLIVQQWRRYFALRAARTGPALAPAAGYGPPPAPQWQPDGSLISGPPLPVDMNLATPAPQSGVVVSAADVAALRQAQQ